ncbi:FAD-linked oxidoreductase apf9 [Pseudocercospora fuligena]|uniref:FAD-linked oxidoreductase apf9 n=1 Tax=Pseudocercospora fuligena TaxID=685502 RepID=A0A8H6R967_9PEZI|nr:FAD-linked oxidoreductase apf9 [Pseudocercospora fuligena]
MLSPELTTALALFLARVSAKQVCKTTPFDSSWPSPNEWSTLNTSLNGALLATTPVASSCWTGNPFDSDISCNLTEANWSSSIFHASRPESIGAWLFANNSCIPPTADGYEKSRGCHLGGLPSYIVNATTETQVAIALSWAATRNIRVVVKGTGHDLSGRSSGAFALSLWTRNFRQLRRETCWQVPGSKNTEDVFIIGSGLGWDDVLDFALDQGRVVTTGQDGSVGPGG